MRLLEPLLKADPYSHDLYLTLKIYLEEDAQPVETARRLFVHRNTVTYRLARIGELLQMDLTRLDTLLLLRLAFSFFEGDLDVTTPQP